MLRVIRVVSDKVGSDGIGQLVGRYILNSKPNRGFCVFFSVNDG